MAQEMDVSGEDVFMSEILTQNECSDDSLMPLGMNCLLREPLKLTKTVLDFNETLTPRIQLANDRKRKNPTRRCLSTDLVDTTPERNLSPTFLQFGPKDDNKCPPILTFTKLSSIENEENESFTANRSATQLREESILTNSLTTNSMSRAFGHKIRKSNSMFSSTPKKPQFIRCHSENEASIMKAVQLSCSDPSLIGDFSKSYALPLIQGKHQDLKSISVDVLAKVIEGHYKDLVESYVVVDCRYPYEYNGGHIRGAKNIYSREAILNEFIKTQTNAPINQMYNKRRILVFHCEFSSERGPNLCRFLRNNDRTTNKDHYPQLHYPEIYILEGGYKAFFEKYRALCEPPEYLPMHSKQHEHELRRFRALVKSLSTDGKNCGPIFKTGNKDY